MDASLDISVVVPVLDEAEALPSFHGELVGALREWPSEREGQPPTVELIYVDDGSTDGTDQVLADLHDKDPDLVRVIVLRRNFGKAGALAAGFRHASGAVVVTLDADGQDLPGEVPRLLEVLDDDRDVVIGWRHPRADGWSKRVTSRVYNTATRWLTGLQLHDFNAGLKVFRREAAEELALYGELHRFVPVLAADLGFRVAEVPVRHRARQAGRSKYRSVWRFPKTLLDLLTVLFLTRFADRPLYLLGGTGLALSAVGGVILTYLAGLKLLTGAGIGHRPLLQLGILLAVLGVQLVGIGFLGDVLRHEHARQEAPYRVRRTLP